MSVSMGAPSGRIASVVSLVLLGSAGACEFDHDTVAAGYYGETKAGSGAAGARLATPAPRSPQTTAGVSGQATAGAASPIVPAPAPTGAAGAAGASAASSCDLSGRWLSTLHTVTDALGNLQTAHSYEYFEITQQANAFTITKGLLCGDDAAGTGSLSVSVDFRASWAAATSKVSFAGRKGTSTPAAAGCRLDLEPWYEVKGASLPYYLDPNVALPTADQSASGSTPGWEDWDNDGNPGITGTLTGAVAGKIFIAPRRWTSASGVADIKATFTLPVQWDVEANIMAYDGTPLLASDAARAADSSLHFAQFARVTLDQVPASDDTQICKSIVTLAPTLTPQAAGM